MTASATIQVLEALGEFSKPGPATVFSHLHVCNAILLIGDEGPKGRIELSKQLGLGEGAVRTMIKRLARSKIITSGPQGCRLTKRGTLLYKRLRGKLSGVLMVAPNQFSLDKASAAVLVRVAGRSVTRGVEQRDAAIRAGATGACTLVYRSNAYRMPLENEEWKLDRQDSLGQILSGLFQPRENDVIIIASAPKTETAKYGAMAAALTLMD
jgi:predicted transcriptional regulator